MTSFHVKCPRCGVEDFLKLSPEDIEKVREYGILRVGFIHRGHVLIIDIDVNYFVRGAYLSTLSRVFPNVKLFFRDYRVIAHPIIRSNTQLAILYEKEKCIDIRALHKYFPRVYDILAEMLNIISKASKYEWYRGELSISDAVFDIASSRGIMILLKTDIKNWKQKTKILRKIHSIVAENGILDHKLLQDIVHAIDNQDIERLLGNTRPT